jgi:hypothetical protein
MTWIVALALAHASARGDHRDAIRDQSGAAILPG